MPETFTFEEASSAPAQQGETFSFEEAQPFVAKTTLVRAPQQGEVSPAEGYGVRVNPVATGNAGLQALQRAPGEAYDAAMTPLVELARAVTPQQVANAVDVAKAEFQTMRQDAQSAMTPEEFASARIRNQATPQREPTGPENVFAGSQNVAAGALNFMASPAGIASLPLAAAPSIIQKGAAGLFLADMARHAPEAVDAAAQATYEGDTFDKTVAYGNLGVLGVMGGAIGKHIAAPGPKGQAIAAVRTMLEKGDIIGATAEAQRAPTGEVRFMDPAQAEGRVRTDWEGRAKAPAEPLAEPISPAPVESRSQNVAPSKPELRPAAGVPDSTAGLAERFLTETEATPFDAAVLEGRAKAPAKPPREVSTAEWIGEQRKQDQAELKRIEALPQAEQPPGIYMRVEAERMVANGLFDSVVQALNSNRDRLKRAAVGTAKVAIKKSEPFHTEYVDTYGVPVPEGWTKRGDLWEPPAKQTAGPAGPAVTTPTGVNPDTVAVTSKATAPAAPVKPFEVVSSSKSYHTIRLPDGSDVTVKARTSADARAKAEQDWTKAQEPPKPRKTANRPVVGDILDEIEQAGGLISKTRARDQGLLTEAKNGPEYNDVTGLASPEHNFIYSNGRGGKGTLTPDKMLEALRSNPKYADLSVPDLWAAIDAASKGRMRQRTAEAQGMRQMKEEAKQATAFGKAQAKEAKTGEIAVVAEDFSVGAELTIGGEKVKVAGFDPETGDLILDDGTKFGRQRVNAQEVVYAEKIKPPDHVPDAGQMVPAPKETGYHMGDQVEYTGVITPDGFREFIWLEGRRKGELGVTMTEAEKAANAARNKKAFDEQQAGFKAVRESGQSDQMPQLKPMQKQGDLMVNQTEDFALTGEKGTDAMRLEAERTAAAQRAAEAKAIADKQQLSLEPPAESNAARIQRQLSNLEHRIKQDKQKGMTRPENTARLTELRDELRNAQPSGGSGNASVGAYSTGTPVVLGGLNAIRPIEVPEMVKLMRELTGNTPFLKKYKNARGMMYSRNGGEIGLNPELFKPGSAEQLAKTLAHEIGHIADYLPDATLARGNLIGRLNTLKRFMGETFGTGGPGNKVVRQELINASAYWRPWNRTTAPKSFIKYRDSAKELYADAISILYNSPGLLEKMAPQFYKELFNKLNTKPAYKTQFLELQRLLQQGPDAVAADRIQRLREQFGKGEELFRQAIEDRANRDRTPHGLAAEIRHQMVDVADKIHRDLRKSGTKLPASQDPRIRWEENLLADNNNLLDIRQIAENVVAPLEAAGLTKEDLGILLKFQREMGARADIANPGGYQMDTAGDTLMRFLNTLKPGQAQALQRAADAFRAKFQARMREAYDVGIVSKKTWEEIVAPNAGNYATFRGLDHVDTYIAPGIIKARGTLGDIENPFISTMLKLESLNRLIMEQKAKIAARDFYAATFPATFSKAPTYFKDGAQVAKPPPDFLKQMTILEDGRRVVYNVDPYIADAFAKLPGGQVSFVTRMLGNVFRGAVYPLIIKYNPGFQLFANPIRDFWRTSRNLGSITGSNSATLAKEYFKAFKTARALVDGLPDPVADNMLRNFAVGGPMDTWGTRFRDDAVGDMLQKYRLLPEKEQTAIKKAAMVVPKWIEHTGAIFEMLPKAASYRFLTESKAMPGPEAAVIVRNYVGTPNYRVKGLHGNINNQIIPFLNIFLQGYRADFDLATRPTTRGGWWFRYFMQDGSKAALMGLAAAGVFGPELKKFYDSQSENDKAQYTVIPLGYVLGGEFGQKGVALKIPRDEVSRFISAGVYRAARVAAGDKAAREVPTEMFKMGADLVPSVTPVLQIGAAWQEYLSGQNPVDSWKQQPIIGNTEFKAGGMPAAKEMVTWTIGKSGALNFVGYNPHADSTTEIAVSGIPVLNRFIKISDYGYREQQLKAEGLEESAKAVLRLDYQPEVRELLMDFARLSKTDAAARTEEQWKRWAFLSEWHKQYKQVDEASWNLDQEGRKADADKLRKDFSKITTTYKEKVLEPNRPKGGSFVPIGSR